VTSTTLALAVLIGRRARLPSGGKTCRGGPHRHRILQSDRSGGEHAGSRTYIDLVAEPSIRGDRRRGRPVMDSVEAMSCWDGSRQRRTGR
jgi:hypothetical protein